MRKSRDLSKKNEKKCTKNLHTSRLAYAEEKIKRKKYICAPYMKADFISSRLLLLYLKASERFQSSLYSLTIIREIEIITCFEIAVS